MGLLHPSEAPSVVSDSHYAASPRLRLPLTWFAADLVSMELSGKRPDVEITADGWFVVAQYNANLAEKCSDPLLAEKFRQRARNALQRLSTFELTPHPATTDLSGHRLGSGAKNYSQSSDPRSNSGDTF